MSTTSYKKTDVGSGREPAIRIRGVRVHNLKNIDVDVPANKLVVLTGLSGSGKSSLALDTIFAEGQRQYIESLSTNARQFFTQLKRPDFDSIDGLQPTLCVDQRQGSKNPRSTVATTSDIHDYLRVLFARLGTALCFNCQTPIASQTVEEIRNQLMKLDEGTKAVVLAPIVKSQRGRHDEVFERIRKERLIRARVDGTICDLDSLPDLSPRKKHSIDAVTDRIIIRPGIESRLIESLTLAINLSGGTAIVCIQNNEPDADAPDVWRDEVFSTRHACPNCELSYSEIEPRTFSFNSPYGACQECAGLGIIVGFDIELLIPDRTLSLMKGAVTVWQNQSRSELQKKLDELQPLLTSLDVAADKSLEQLDEATWLRLVHGYHGHIGLLTVVEKDYAVASTQRMAELEPFRATLNCPTCLGGRVRREALSVFIEQRSIADFCALPVKTALEFVGSIRFEGNDALIAGPLISQIVNRLKFLEKVGLSYLTLDRPVDTLSGGEFQRIRLATSIGSGLCGVCYVLDEPSIGLHSRDNSRLIEAIRNLQGQGNTIIVVEHDEAIMRAADYLIDLGPGAGDQGGHIVAQGCPQEFVEQTNSSTARYLVGKQKIDVPAKRRSVETSRAINVVEANGNNLKNISVDFPLGVFVCVTGVSGSGKSTLVNDSLSSAIRRQLGLMSARPAQLASISGVDQIDKLIEFDQSPIGKNARGCAATYCGVFDEIRKIYAATQLARQLGFNANRFSFNAKEGSCPNCQGFGVNRIKMNFLPDIFVTCETCGGSRFNHQTLQVRYRNRTIADILEMSVDEALAFFENLEKIRHTLVCLNEVGLGYLPLGQPSTTISGGEAQRIKLATELSRAETGNTLYLLDEPTTGLHFEDVKHLLIILNRLVDQGNSMIVIEHNLDVIKTADWVIDLGPDGGETGGHLVATGTPEQIADNHASVTGQFLRPYLTT